MATNCLVTISFNLHKARHMQIFLTTKLKEKDKKKCWKFFQITYQDKTTQETSASFLKHDTCNYGNYFQTVLQGKLP